MLRKILILISITSLILSISLIKNTANATTDITLVQYSAFSSIPYPNCLDDLGDIVVLHQVGSCSEKPTYDNLAYFADLNYHVQSAVHNQNLKAPEVTITLEKTNVPNTYNQILREVLVKEGVLPSLN